MFIPSLTETRETDDVNMKNDLDQKKEFTGLWACTPGLFEEQAHLSLTDTEETDDEDIKDDLHQKKEQAGAGVGPSSGLVKS